AMRWVMGENSYKSMRASGMDDVIFSGSDNRASRNTAEVALVLDNMDRSAPAAFNDAEMLEVSRRIERESGSTYKINGKEVRARDVQLLFADASTGARSPAMVRQGQIGEIISAKPQQRRRILEEAAGVAGLHSRRHEAELRLKAAEDNLNRLEDVMKQLDSQVDSLKRQARQATRYKSLAGDIKQAEALLHMINYKSITRAITEADRKLEADVRELAERTRQQAEAARLQAVAAHELPPLRDAEAAAGATLQRLVMAREQLDGEEQRAKQRMAELERRLAQLDKDLAREKALIEDAAEVLARLDTEDGELEAAGQAAEEIEFDAKATVADAEGKLADCERGLAEAQAALSDLNARRAALEQGVALETQQVTRFAAELTGVINELMALQEAAGSEEELAALADQLAQAESAVEAAEKNAADSEEAHRTAREAEHATRGPHTDAERRAQRLETEVRTLTKLLATAASDLWPPVVEEMSVEKGYEAALGAALGDDLEASSNTSAPLHWGLSGDASQDAPLPPGVESLVRLVKAPAALQRRLNQIGIVVRSDGAQLQKLLKPGQRLVSKEGDLWRWDGFVAAAEAPTPAARRLTEKNRLGDLTLEADAAREQADRLRAQLEKAQQDIREAAQRETMARNEARNAARSLSEAHEALSAAERKRGQVAARLSALTEAQNRLAQNRDEANNKLASAQQALDTLAPTVQLTSKLEKTRASTGHARAEAAEARANLQSILREAQTRQARRAAIANERQGWDSRRGRAHAQISDFEARIEETRGEMELLAEAPEQFMEKRRALLDEVEK
ncbi:MAG: chromosome segregation protein SMC, partial [Alphaproteobacteria bacterium]|nr:chromosome segregation protein SMC [Alphaproteobacteria bacterium]